MAFHFLRAYRSNAKALLGSLGPRQMVGPVGAEEYAGRRPRLAEHQKGPAASRLVDSAELIKLATSKRLLRLLGRRFGKVPMSSLTASFRYCQTSRQGKSDLPVAELQRGGKIDGIPISEVKTNEYARPTR